MTGKAVIHHSRSKVSDANLIQKLKTNGVNESYAKIKRVSCIFQQGGANLNENWIKFLHKREAKLSIGASTARGLKKGTVEAARTFLANLNPTRFLKASQEDFIQELDAATLELVDALPEGARCWGFARKFINIFLRGCAYNKYLCNYYRLESIEAWLEVPLDALVAKGLSTECSKSGEWKGLAKSWSGVFRLSYRDNVIYQRCAHFVAHENGINRIDLDAKFWAIDL